MSVVMKAGLLTLAFMCGISVTQGQQQQQPSIEVAITLDVPVTGVSTTPEGRIFLIYARVDGSQGPQVVEWNESENTTTPIPDAEWNAFSEDKDPATHLIRTNSQRIGPDGALWLVDVGSTSFGAPVIFPDGPKLVQFNLTTNQVQRTYSLGNATRSNSLLDDVRFNPITGKAYLTDAGSPGLIVLDLASGFAVRVLDDHLSTRRNFPVSAEGTLMHGPDGGYLYVYADHHEVSPDGRYYYFQPANGGLSRIETRYLDQALYNSSLNANGVIGEYVEPFALTPSTGGTAIDARGNIYSSDTDRLAIEKIAPNGTRTTLVQDPRLLWVDAMWIDAKGKLWMPAAQLSRGVPFNNGTNKIVKPLYVFTVDIGVGPSPIDHA